MSKKKAAATMSLKDFHGGSIPSDLPLPSAPGALVKPGSERSTRTNWGNNLIRSDLRPRPKSSGAAHSFDEKASFLSHLAPIGRNFDEDERKPLNSGSAPRQTISDESICSSAPVHQESKMDHTSPVKVPARLVSGPGSQSPNSDNSQSPARFRGGASSMFNSQNTSSHNGQVAQYSKNPSDNYSHVVNNPPNAWGVRKEMMGASEGREAGNLSVSPGADTVSKFSQASAIEKLSSGLWQLKNPSHLLPHLMYSRDNVVIHGVDVGSERGAYNASRKSHVEAVWVAEDGNQGWEKELMNSGKVRSEIYAEEPRAGPSGARSQFPSTMPLQLSEQHKSKLLSGSKSLEMESLENNKRQGYQQAMDTRGMEVAQESYRNSNPRKPITTDSKTDSQPVDRLVERHRLNLMPRSQLVDQTDESLKRERNTLFGGARPREVVLKERGDITIHNPDVSHLPDRAQRVNSPKKEVSSEHFVANSRHGQRVENQALNRRTGRDSQHKDKRMDQDKVNAERRNWQNKNWRSSRDAKDQQHEPETWRKPIEKPTPAFHDASGICHGKLVSALELAHAFSKSVSSPKIPDLPSTQGGLSGHKNQVPFSRLADTHSHEVYSAST